MYIREMSKEGIAEICRKYMAELGLPEYRYPDYIEVRCQEVV